MLHARPDYAHITDPTGRIAADEPVFVIRAKDAAAPATVEAWADFNDKLGGDPFLSRQAREHAQAMRVWQQINGCKPADY